MDTSGVGETLCEEILYKLKEELDSGICQELTTVWKELWGETEIVKRQHILAAECKKEIKEFLHDILLSEKKVRDDYIKRVENLLNEMSDLQKTLDTVIPYEDVENLPLHIMAARLNKKAEKYRAMRTEHVHKLNVLAEKEAELCQKLGMIQQIKNTSEIPTKARLNLLTNHIAAMEEEKKNRTLTVLEQRQVIIKLYEELGTKPFLKFELEVASEEVLETFAFTNENMAKLHELRDKLETQAKEAREKVEELLKKLKLLWSYLDEEEHDEFLSKNVGFTVAVMKTLEDELERCKAKKRENIRTIVERMRKMLVEEWDRCLIGEEERKNLHIFYSSCFTEDLCDLHELEITRLKNFYRDNEQIFVNIAKHQKLFNKLLELEHKSKNANRYYNRGGQLLQEEKERKIITKELPIVEEELRALLKKYEEEHGRAFTSSGVPVVDILDEQWKAHFDQKTIEKLSRKKAGRTPLGKRTCTTPRTPLYANKVPKLNGEKTATKHGTPAQNVTFRRKKNNVAEGSEALTTLQDPSYHDFQSDLQTIIDRSTRYKKPVPRSTAVDDFAAGILLERNTPDSVRPAASCKTTPRKLSSLRTPKTLPRTLPRARRQSKSPFLTPAHCLFPIDI